MTDIIKSLTKSEGRRLAIVILISAFVFIVSVVIATVSFHRATQTTPFLVVKTFVAKGEPLRPGVFEKTTGKLPADVPYVPVDALAVLPHYFASHDLTPGEVLTYRDVSSKPALPPGIVLYPVTINGTVNPFLAPNEWIDIIPNNASSPDSIFRVYVANYYPAAVTGGSPLLILELPTTQIQTLQNVTSSGWTIGFEPGLNGPKAPTPASITTSSQNTQSASSSGSSLNSPPFGAGQSGMGEGPPNSPATQSSTPPPPAYP